MSIFSSIKVSVPTSAAFAVAVVIFSALSASFFGFPFCPLHMPYWPIRATADFLASLSALAAFDFLYRPHGFLLMGPSLFLAANFFSSLSLILFAAAATCLASNSKSALIFFLKFACNAASILGSIFSSHHRLKINVRIGLERLLWMSWTTS